MVKRACVVLSLLLAALAGADDRIVVGRTSRIRSEILHEDRTVRVFLPRSYGWAADRRYPVLYVLDGESAFVPAAASVDHLAAAGEIPEMIVVGVDSTVRIRDFTQTDWREAWVGGGGAANFKAFLARELLPKIDGSYRTNGFRVLSGHSAGGQFALYCLASDPSLFQAYFALSPSLDWDHNLPQRSLEAALAATESLRAFLYVARSDDFGRALADFERLVRTLEATAPRGFRWASAAFPLESHVSVTLLAEIDALRRLFSGYRFPGDLLAQGIDFAQAHFDAVAKVVGYPIGVPEDVVNTLGYEALSAGKTEDALALFRRSVEASPNSTNAWDSLADGLASAARWKEAAEAVERAVDLATRFDHPDRASFAEHARKLHERLGEAAKGEAGSRE